METITENNKLIAEFLQPNTKHDNFYFPQFKEPYIYQEVLNGYNEVFRVQDLKFHSDWNWLMEVVEKIESLGYSFTIIGNLCIISRPSFKSIRSEDETKFKAVYQAILDFIKWYNEQNK